MKTEQEIREKIKEHEDHITALLEGNRFEWTDVDVMCIESYLQGRKALLWALSDKNLIDTDDFEKHAKYECLCFDSGKIF